MKSRKSICAFLGIMILSISMICTACGNSAKPEAGGDGTAQSIDSTVSDKSSDSETAKGSSDVTDGKEDSSGSETADAGTKISFDAHINRIQANGYATIGLTSEGKLIACAPPAEGENVVETEGDYVTWTGVKNFDSNSGATAAVLEDGTVVMCGGLKDEMEYCDFSPVAEWKDVVQVAMGKREIIALKADGSIEMAGDLMTEDLDDTTGFVQVEDGCDPIGLKADGTVVVWDWWWEDPIDDVSTWTDITEISCSWNHIVGLKADGTVVAAGNNEFGQCDVSDWTDIIAVSAGVEYTIGLRADGTVVACGSDDNGKTNVNDWTDIVEIDAGYHHCAGIRSDGSVVATGGNWQGQLNVEGWNLN